MARPKLKVEKRKESGRKVKKLRAAGLLPANIYGQKIKSLSIQLEIKDFRPIYNEAGETGLVDLVISSEKSVRPVLIHNVQLHPVTAQLLHVDFHQVDLTQKVKASIPIEIVGESPAVSQKLGILVRLMDEMEVEALPADLPEKIEVDISSLVQVGDMVKVSQVKIGDKAVPSVDDDEPLVKIESPTKAEEEKPVQTEDEEGEEKEGAEGDSEKGEDEAKAQSAGDKSEKKEESEKE